MIKQMLKERASVLFFYYSEHLYSPLIYGYRVIKKKKTLYSD